MKVEVLGTGCAKCKKLYAEVEKAIESAGLPAQLEKVEEIEQIMKSGVMTTPAVVVNGAVKSMGRIPPVAEIASWLTSAAAEESA